MKKITFVTTNQGKIREAKEILTIKIKPIKLNIEEIQTLNPIKCVTKKAQAAFNQVKTPILVEDTSLFFNSWDKLPGVFIDYFMKTLGNKGLLKLLGDEQNREAIAQTSLCYFDGQKKITAIGKLKGKIVKKIKGSKGFGWDPIFIPAGQNKTFAEMTKKEKNKLSMRKLALIKLNNLFKIRLDI